MMVEKQSEFLQTVAIFVQKATEMGFLLTCGEFWRPEELALIYKRLGKGIENSLHCIRLAADINAFMDGEYLDGSKPSHIPLLKQLGELWLSLDDRCAWGGHFSHKDYNHYSFEHNGVK
jgi:hypothetical protein